MVFDRIEQPGQPGAAPGDDEFLRELAQNTATNIRAQRAHERVPVRCAIAAAPGNASDRVVEPVRGTALDLSVRGCMSVFERPLSIGDIYLLRFDRSVVDVPLLFARCLRGRMVSEDAFEFGFSFFDAIDLAAALKRGDAASAA